MNAQSSRAVQYLLASLVVCLLSVSAALAYDPTEAAKLNKTGERLLNEGKFAGALKAFEELESVCGTDGFCRAVAMFGQAKCLYETDRNQEALDLFRKVKVEFGRGHEMQKAIAQLMEGATLVNLHRYQEALAACEKIEPFFREKGESKNWNLFSTYLCQTQAYTELLDLKKADEILTKAEGVYGLPNPNNTSLAKFQAKTDWCRAEIFRLRGDFKNADVRYERLLKLDKGNPNPKTEARIYNAQGYLYWMQGRYSEALTLFGQALPLAQKAGSLETGQIFKNIGLVKSDQGDYQAAIESIEQSRSIFHNLGDSLNEVQGTNILALIYYFLGDYDKADKLFAEAYETTHQNNWYRIEGYVLNNRALILRDQGEFHQSQKIRRGVHKFSQEGRG